MSRKNGGSTQTSTTQTQENTRESRRVTSLEPKHKKTLTSLEEAVVRMHHGISVKPSAQLSTNGVNEKVMGELVEIEVRSYIETGRANDLPDVPKTKKRAANPRTAKVVAALKKKK